MRISCFQGRQPRPQRPALRCLVLLGLALSLSSLPCRAALGGAPSDFGRASVRHASALAASPAGNAALQGASSYRVDTNVLDNGTTVREYVSNGVVFAVTWRGPLLPDLRELLGQHFATLTSETARRARSGNSPVRIALPDVTIESTGHMRAFAGRAWSNGLLPAGFDTDEIK